jgi:guanylate kinase
MSVTAGGRLIVVSGPSGAGKTTVLRRVFERAPLPLVASISATTRPPRPGECDGVDYHFLSPEEFETRRQRGDFLECFQVFGHDYWYGTLHSEVTAGLAAGKWVVLRIDVQGALAVMERYHDAITIFIRPSSIAELQRRLRGRGTESEEVIQKRLARAQYELTLADCYRYQVVNDDLQQAVTQVCTILTEQWESSGDD